jgi:hypothetical protein
MRNAAAPRIGVPTAPATATRRVMILDMTSPFPRPRDGLRMFLS